jgi:hypothetical protein
MGIAGRAMGLPKACSSRARSVDAEHYPCCFLSEGCRDDDLELDGVARWVVLAVLRDDYGSLLTGRLSLVSTAPASQNRDPYPRRAIYVVRLNVAANGALSSERPNCFES